MTASIAPLETSQRRLTPALRRFVCVQCRAQVTIQRRQISISTAPVNSSFDGPNQQDTQYTEPQADTPSHGSVPSHLPLSPLMNPLHLRGRNRYSESKPRPKKESQTRFQRKLERNPFAQALDTPMRECNPTRAYLPSFFLQPFELIKRSNEPPPSDSTRQRSSAPLYFSPLGLAFPKPIAPNLDHGKGTREPRSSQAGDGQKKGRDLTARVVSYVLMDLPIIRSPRGARPSKRPAKILLHDRLLNSVTRSRIDTSQQLVWMDSMDSYILDLLRQRVVEEVLYLLNRDVGYVYSCTNLSSVSGNQAALLLHLGSLSDHSGEDSLKDSTCQGRTVENSGDDGDLHVDSKPTREVHGLMQPDLKSLRRPLPQLITIREGEVPLPLFDLPHLLGKSAFESLLARLPQEFRRQENVAIVKSRRRTASLGLWLWKLQCFTDSDKPGAEISASQDHSSVFYDQHHEET